MPGRAAPPSGGPRPDAAGWPEGYGRQIHDALDSTNAEALRQAMAGVAGPVWILAREQTAGRGRRGRPWLGQGGNFAASLLMRPDGGPAAAAQRSFVAALALADALAPLAGPAKAAITLKWPNDVLLNEGKVAGILLESAGQRGRLAHLVVGVGVNLVHAPDPAAVEPGAVPPVSVLSETGAAPTPEALLTALAAAFARHEADYLLRGFAPIRAAWLARAARLGQAVTARAGNEVIRGRFETLDAEGALVLETAAGRRSVPAADLYF